MVGVVAERSSESPEPSAARESSRGTSGPPASTAASRSPVTSTPRRVAAARWRPSGSCDGIPSPMRPPLAPALALLVAAAPASASPHLHGIPAHVRAGQELRLTRSGLGREAQEAELELSLAGGRWVRISPELEAREGGFAWRVPAALAGPARLRLKYGGERFEAEGEVSTPFVIEADPAAVVSRAPGAALAEWWSGPHSGARPSPSVSGAASLHATGPAVALSPEPDRVARAADTPVARSRFRASPRTRADAVVRGSPPRSFPLRI